MNLSNACCFIPSISFINEFCVIKRLVVSLNAIRGGSDSRRINDSVNSKTFCPMKFLNCIAYLVFPSFNNSFKNFLYCFQC